MGTFHPELNYRNLCVGYNNPHTGYCYIPKKQLLRLIRIPDSIYDLGGYIILLWDDSTAILFLQLYDQYGSSRIMNHR